MYRFSLSSLIIHHVFFKLQEIKFNNPYIFLKLMDQIHHYLYYYKNSPTTNHTYSVVLLCVQISFFFFTFSVSALSCFFYGRALHGGTDLVKVYGP